MCFALAIFFCSFKLQDMKNKTGKLFLLSAPSGCGKTSVTLRALDQLQADQYNISRVVTYTTREPRLTDKSGIDYHFLSALEFENKIKENFFLEWSKAYHNYYGTPGDMISQIERGLSYIAIVDRLGVTSITQKYEKAVSIWLEPPSLEELKQRLYSRQSETEEQIKRRLSLAEQELLESVRSPYAYHVVNDVFDETVLYLCSIIKKELE
jgi:guanylate kinase